MYDCSQGYNEKEKEDKFCAVTYGYAKKLPTLQQMRKKTININGTYSKSSCAREFMASKVHLDQGRKFAETYSRALPCYRGQLDQKFLSWHKGEFQV